MSPKTEIQSRQIQWAVSAGLDPDSRGYLPSYSENLFQVLNPKSKSSFDQGSGSELEDTPRRPAKMRALHSSSALAVNFFDTWVASENSPLLNALELGLGTADISFEGQYPTGLPGNPPNLDVVLTLQDGFVIGIESKFTEWLTPKPSSKAPFKDKYFPTGTGVWEQVGLPQTQRLAERMHSGDLAFRYLDAAQLMKHALGLATHCGGNFRLFYIYFDASGAETGAHRQEVDIFDQQLGEELGFRAFTYQSLIDKLAGMANVPMDYLAYLQARYC